MESNQIWYVNRTVAELFSAPWCCDHVPVIHSFWHLTCSKFFPLSCLHQRFQEVLNSLLPHGLHSSLLLVKENIFKNIHSLKWDNRYQPVHSEGDQPWDFFGRNDAKAETPVLWPPRAKSWLIGRLWCWEGLGAGGEGDDRGWDGWMASPTRWTWVWVNSGSWWWIGRPGMLWFMGSQRVRHDWATELNWTDMETSTEF